MPFDPTKPEDDSLLSAQEMREQLNGLHAEIAPGPPGPPGEVSAQQLFEAIATTARDPVNIQPTGFQISDPPTQSEMQAIADFLNALANALKRQV